ncbi:MAG: alpha/beta hydrolase [Solirubrobacterales bacterium]
MLRRLFASVILLAGCLLASLSQAADKVGVVLMHGKAGDPSHLRSLADDLTAAGYLVATPTMPWSAARRYDGSLDEAHAEIDATVAELKRQGARKIVVAGHSMGANTAIGYAATHPGLVDALIALGPGQTVEGAVFRDRLGASVARARNLIAKGRGDEPAEFDDLHLGKVGTVTATARVYLSYFNPDGLANMPATAPRLALPFLWTVGRADRNMLERGSAYAFDRAQPNPSSRYVEVDADHMGTPDASRTVVLDWLGAVFATGR